MRLALAFLVACHAPRVASDEARATPLHAVPAELGDPVPSLRALVGAKRGPQHFCVVAYRDQDGPPHAWAWVHWSEARKIILWEGGDTLIHSRRDLDLDRDVVPTLDDVHGSTYLITRAWLEETLADCAKHGTRFVIDS